MVSSDLRRSVPFTACPVTMSIHPAPERALEPGRVYVESDGNGILGQVHDDYAALRRYLVDEGLLERRDGFYWRTGGTFEV